MRWPNTTTPLCSPEQLADSLAGYMLSGEVRELGEVWALTLAVFHLPIASLLARAAGADTMQAAISWAVALRVGAHTSATADRAAA